MSEPEEILLACDNGNCPLHSQVSTLASERRRGYLPDIEIARKTKVECFRCLAAEPQRTGYLVYIPLEEFAVIAAQQSLDNAARQVLPWQRVPRQEISAVPGTTENKTTNDPGATAVNQIPVGVVLDVVPYGGYILRYQDSDEGAKYGARNDKLPDQKKPKPDYVLQLQEDLIFCCYWNTSRALPKSPKASPGVFHYSMIGSLLALKEDLHTFYGVPTTLSLDATKTSVSAGSVLSLSGLNLPIYYDPKLENPIRRMFKQVLDRIRASHDVAVHIAGEWKKLLARRKKNGAFKQSEHKPLAELVEQALYARVECDGAVARGRSASYQRRAPASVNALLGDAELAVERETGKGNWTAFEDVVNFWDERRRGGLGEAVDQCLASLQGFTLGPKDDPGIAVPLDELLKSYGSLSVSLQSAPELCWELLGAIPSVFASYRDELREYACVDWATAAYIHAMRQQVPIGGNGAIRRGGGLLAFRLPDEGIDVGVDLSVDASFKMAIKVAKDKDVPPPIVLERFSGESGFKHVYELEKFYTIKAHRNARLPIMGTDYANWCPLGGTKSNYAYSELFTGGPGDWDHGGGRGYGGPLMMSRGWGVSQATRGTYVEGVTPKNRSSESDGLRWILGLPVPSSNAKIDIPAFIGSTAGGIADGVGILQNKFSQFTKKKQRCTYEQAGGKRHDCHSCLQRFNPQTDFAHDGNTYRLVVSDERFLALIGVPPTEERGRLEFPCSWLTAVMRYAGTGARAFKRLQSTATIIASPPAAGELAKYVKDGTW